MSYVRDEEFFVPGQGPQRSEVVYLYRSKTVKETHRLVWEIEGMEEIMSEGTHKLAQIDFQMKGEQGKTPPSTWRLQLDTFKDEPALTIHLLAPLKGSTPRKAIYYNLHARVDPPEELNFKIFTHPKDKVSYLVTDWTEAESSKAVKYALHRHLDFGCSYSSWMPMCLTPEGALRLEITLKTFQSTQEETDTTVIHY